MEGTFEEHIDWSCDVELNAPGVFTFQIIQILDHPQQETDFLPIKIKANSLATHNTLGHEDSDNLVYFPHINHLVVQPLYQNEFLDVSSKSFDFISQCLLKQSS